MTNPFSGVELLAYAALESSFDIIQAITGADALSVIEMKFEPSKDFHPLKEHVGSQSLQGWVAGKQEGKWSCKVYFKPNAAGTPPDCDALLEAAFGVKTVVASTSVTYSLAPASVAPKSVQLVNAIGTDFAEVASGCWVEKPEFDIPSGGEPGMITFTGGFSSYGYVRAGFNTDATGYTAQTVITLENAGDSSRIAPGVFIKIGSDDNSGAGYRVTAVDRTNNTITLATAITLSAANHAIVPHYPTPVVSGTVLGSIACGLDLDGNALEFNSAKISLDTGNVGLNKAATIDRPNRLSKGKRLVSGEVEAFELEENAPFFLGGPWDGTVRDTLFRVGADVAGQRVKIDIPAMRVDVTPRNIPEAEAASANVKFEAKRDAANDDEIKLIFD